MKKFRKPRDDGRFALTTLQNPTLEVRGLRQLIATAEQIVVQEAAAPDALPSDDTPPPKEVQLSPEKTAADDPLPERGRPSQNCSPPNPQNSRAQNRAVIARENRAKQPRSRARGANSPTSSANAPSASIPIATGVRQPFPSDAQRHVLIVTFLRV
jgi:hypothetical protein